MAPFRSRFPFVSPHFGFGFGFLFVVCYTVYCTYISLCCVFLHFNIHILDAFFNDLLGLSVNETVFSTSTWYFGRLFFFCFFLFWQNFSQWNFFDLCLWDFFYFLFGISAHSCPLYTPLCARCCCLLCPLRRVEFCFCFWQIVSNEFSLDTAVFLAWLPLQLFTLSPPTTSPPTPCLGNLSVNFNDERRCLQFIWICDHFYELFRERNLARDPLPRPRHAYEASQVVAEKERGGGERKGAFIYKLTSCGTTNFARKSLGCENREDCRDRRL